MADEANVAEGAPAPAQGGGGKLVPIMLVTNTLLMAGVLFMVLRKPSGAPSQL